ncbi:glycosyltransferase [Planosporangium thailandense]|uniref:Glycosyltransferase n=1 Tax=Planosporangium thailandense TaxID=765197 RepID=A0ABX0XX61_9ACTN|nr:glycosyltransferase family A protein [Planosporangium thailandense]NJC69754.1 glycosyltransferase [Planosporangium thailandense]
MIAWAVTAVVAALTVHTGVNAALLRRPPARPPTVDRPVAVLLPVRDEAHRVEPCLRALLAQQGVPDLEIVVLDDGSGDGTADLVRAIGGDRVRLLTGAPLPAGWLGKPYACAQLAAATAAEVLVFVDADVVLAPHAVAAAVALLDDVDKVAGGDSFDLVSPYPKILGQPLVQQLLQWSWLTFLPLRAMERSRRPSLAAAGGQFLAVRADTYARAGGHAAVRDRVLEDIELARAVKRAGGRIALADGSALATCRMYASWRELADGYGKSLWASFGSPGAAAAVVAMLIALYVLPFALLLTGPAAVRTAGLAGYLCGVAGRVVAARATGGRPFPVALAHPAAIVTFAILLGVSFRRRRHGTLTWKNRPVEAHEGTP